ncbi:MAG: NADH:flavin oxidoreductase [Spirochaetales bacterium]
MKESQKNSVTEKDRFVKKPATTFVHIDPISAISSIFTPGYIGGRKVINRFVSQAMEGNDGGPEGDVSDRTLSRYLRLAEGQWGVVIVEALSVVEESIARPYGLVLNRQTLDGYKRLVEAFKEKAPDTLLIFQLTHSGRHSLSFSRRVCIYPEGEAGEGAELLSTEEIDRIRDRFIEAALLSEQAGADGIDFKLCHGYFGAEMLRPANRRQDRWGGSFENRTRFIREVVEGARSALRSSQFLLGSRLSFYEAIRGGCGTLGPDEIIEDLSEMVTITRLLKELGMVYVNVSAGIPSLTAEITRPTKVSQYFVYHHFRYARLAKQNVPELAVIGSAYSALREQGLAWAAENLQKGYVDFIGFGRQSFADPLFPKKLQEGINSVHWCTTCSGCSKLMAAGLHDGCVVFDPYYKELLRNLNAKKA